MLTYVISWEQHKLGELADIVGGGTPSTSNFEYWDGDIDWYAPAEIADQIFVSSSERKITQQGYDNSSAKMLPVGTVLFTSRAGIGKTAILRKEGCTNQGFQSIVPHINELDSYFIFSRSEEMKKYGETVGAGSTFVEVSGKQMANMELMMPTTMEEQVTIGSFFRNLDSIITLHQREYFSFDFDSQSAIIAQNTFSWEQRKLENITSLITKGTTPKDKSGNGEVNFIKVENIDPSSGIISSCSRISLEEHEGYLKRSQLKENDILFSIAGTLGRTSVVNKGILPANTNQALAILRVSEGDISYLVTVLSGRAVSDFIKKNPTVGAQPNLSLEQVSNLEIPYPSIEEQQKIGDYFRNLDDLITLHQREPPKEDKILNDIKTDTLFHEYYCQWLVIYKEGSVRGVTMQKYHLTAEWVKKLIPDVKLCDFDRITYQQLINDYAETHERQTTMDFHHQLKGAILDAVDDGLIARDPTRKVIIKGKSPNDKKKKYLSRYELQKLLTSLDLNSGLNMDWLILLIAKTGMRFSEAIAVTPMDFDFTHQTLSVNKTWDYKGEGGFQPTKNKSSVRKIRLDWQTVGQFYAIVRELNDTAPIFVSKEKKIYNSTLNDVLERHCKAVGIPTISVHGLRHTHASLLLFDGVSIASVAQRLGHSSINTTQKTYLHIIRELENKDIDLIMKSISSLLD